MFPSWWLRGLDPSKLESEEPYPGAFREVGRWIAGAGVTSAVAGFWWKKPFLILFGTFMIVLGCVLVGLSGPIRRPLARRTAGPPATQPFRQPAKVDYLGGQPAWPVKVVHPGRFRGVEYDLQFALFRLPQGAIVACLLRLYDIPESPYFLHRVFDVGYAPVRDYLRAVAEGSEWTLVLESKGTEGSVRRRLEVNGRLLERLLREADRYNERLPKIEGAKALDQFLQVFEPEAERGGCEAGWRAVERWSERHGLI